MPGPLAGTSLPVRLRLQAPSQRPALGVWAAVNTAAAIEATPAPGRVNLSL